MGLVITTPGLVLRVVDFIPAYVTKVAGKGPDTFTGISERVGVNAIHLLAKR